MNDFKDTVIVPEADSTSSPEISIASLDPYAWRRFLIKNGLIYVITNTIFNAIVPYSSLKDLPSVYLFEGTYCIARFLLPIAFFIPMVITIDATNKAYALSRKKIPGFSLPEGFHYKKYLLKGSLVNGVCSLMITAVAMGILQFSMPKGYAYNILISSILLGIYAGSISLYFMKRSMYRFIGLR